MEGSGLRHRQINERMARVVDQFEICVTMAWYGMAGRRRGAPETLRTMAAALNIDPAWITRDA
jgi:hypothetical protein